ncbi:MAG: acetyl-CoA carboxylase biotin carboxylase subunit [Spirochaetales bacterium]|nr:acetyl-CoA carboxylase biotin carboxylase subunit [Spirochaetales bacterium]
MVKSILIANRGEIAVRVIRACREMGIRSVAVYSEADADALHVDLADEAVCIGPPDARKSYLNIPNLITAAVSTGCDAVHPGVGFLAENSGFARSVINAGLHFIGPAPEVIDFLGDKIKAKKSARDADIPVTPGSDGPVENVEEALKIADEIGFPLIIKAAAGGGGKGIRIVTKQEDLESTVKIAAHEAEMAFSDGTLYIEKYIQKPRHVEVQILADNTGNVVHLGERDCSVQQNHQKLVEESPSPGVTDEMRQNMCADAVRLFKKLKYTGAGTIEFLVEGEKYYFMEVNARVQVEHPVSEYISGVDIIKEQILTCTGGKLPFTQDEIRLEGWSIECRINAKSPGKIIQLHTPGGLGVRIDSFLYPGCTVPPFYDALVSKVIVYGKTRDECIKRMLRVLDEFVLEGIKTNIDMQKQIINSKQFRSGNFGTDVLGFILKE